jgi:hypothetical protein
MSSGSQFLHRTGDAVSDFSLPSSRHADALSLALAGSHFRRPPSGVDCAQDGRVLPGAVSLRWGVRPLARPSLCRVSFTPSGNIQRSAVSAPFTHVRVPMHEDGRDPWSPMPTPLGSPAPEGSGCPCATRVPSGFENGWGKGGKVWCRHLKELMLVPTACWPGPGRGKQASRAPPIRFRVTHAGPR